jgi:asparagine synthase (glutamine-hydrolysing)
MCGFLTYQGSTTDFSLDSKNNFESVFASLKHRGPDQTVILPLEKALFGFHRLAIMDLEETGAQPFSDGKRVIVCNGEIYNYQALRKLMSSFQYQSGSDCEVLLPLFQHYTIDHIVQLLDGEYALVAYLAESESFVAARDAMGIRPLFWGKSKSGKMSFASEAKALSFCDEVTPFPPGHFYDGEQLHCYIDLAQAPQEEVVVKDFFDVQTMQVKPALTEMLKPVHDLLVEGVRKRLHSDAPLGALLSGGLDSSLVCSIAMRELAGRAPLKTFAVGMDKDPIDLRYAKEVAEFIGSDHTEIILTRQDLVDNLERVIWHLETWDITTIRASLGMYLLCKKIRETTDIKVLLTGEVSDEIFGYKYTDFAPSAKEFQNEAAKRVRELYLYDVLRADRCIAGASLEARVPFSDSAFVQYVMSMPAELKRNHYKQGKFLLREAFRAGNYLPKRLLEREKAAFSDAVGHSLVDSLKELASEQFSSTDLEKARDLYPHGTPFTLESLLYRSIFEKFYPGRAKMIPAFWMPNKKWENCNVDDPSARVLPNYGASGV